MPNPRPGGGGDYGAQAAAAAVGQQGVPYRWGGESPKGTANPGFDCSGLVGWAWAKAGKHIPRTTFAEYPAMRPVSKSNLQAGDLLFYYWNDGGAGPGHVVMYLGGGHIVQAAHTGTKVAVGPVFWTGYVGARRPYGVPQTGGAVNLPTAKGQAGQMPSQGGAPATTVKGSGHEGAFPYGIPGIINSLIPGRQYAGKTWAEAAKSIPGDIHVGPFPVPGTGGISGFFTNLVRYMEIGSGGVLMLFGGAVIVYGASGSKTLGKAGAAAIALASRVPSGRSAEPSIRSAPIRDTDRSREVSDLARERAYRRDRAAARLEVTRKERAR